MPPPRHEARRTCRRRHRVSFADPNRRPRTDAATPPTRNALAAKALESRCKFQQPCSCWKIKRNADWRQCGKTGFCPAPWARHICRNKNQNVFSSVLVAPQSEAKADRSGIFRRNDFQKMPLRRSFLQSGKFSTRISLQAELEHAEFTAETRRKKFRRDFLLGFRLVKKSKTFLCAFCIMPHTHCVPHP